MKSIDFVFIVLGIYNFDIYDVYLHSCSAAREATKGSFLSESSMGLKKIFQITLLSRKFEKIVYYYGREI
jgi:hypothetical protein